MESAEHFCETLSFEFCVLGCAKNLDHKTRK